MKELSVEQKAKAYDEAKLRIRAAYNSNRCTIGFMNEIFPELKESEDERIRKVIGYAIGQSTHSDGTLINGVSSEEALAWLEKQGEQSICNIPSREIIFAIWDLGNEWKELTKGSISTEYGTQLEYIQKHWQESEHYLRAKQGEQKPIIEMKTPEESLGITSKEWNEIENECIFGEDKPRFKVGDWIVSGYNSVAYIESISETKYNLQCKDGSHEKLSVDYINRCWHLWTIQDAKDGDVLAVDPIEGYPSSFVVIYKKQNEEDFGDYNSYCFVGFNGKFYEGEEGHSTEDIHPATKEQRDLLFQKMSEAGYEWDAEKKESSKIDKENLSEFEIAVKNVMEEAIEAGDTHNLKADAENLLRIIQPTWTEEDENRLKSCLNILQPKTLTGNIETINTKWLKSLKERLL